MFVDDAEAAILYPVYTWPNSSKKGPKQVIWHQDDILSMEFCPPDLIATSSYTGNIVILSLQSGHLLYSFNPHDDRCPEFPAQQKSIDKCIKLLI
jgi:WD40 repeat protein